MIFVYKHSRLSAGLSWATLEDRVRVGPGPGGELKARLTAGESWHDNDLIFCQGDGTPYKPDAVTRRFKHLAALAGCR
jgi:hypothetical protein